MTAGARPQSASGLLLRPQAAPPPEAAQRALADPLGARPGEILALQRPIGRQAGNKRLAGAANPADPPPSGNGPRGHLKLEKDQRG